MTKRELVGQRISVYWSDDSKWFSGTVINYVSTEGHTVHYDDAVVLTHNLEKERWKGSKWERAQRAAQKGGGKTKRNQTHKRAVHSLPSGWRPEHRVSCTGRKYNVLLRPKRRVC